MTNIVEITPRNKGVPGTNITMTFQNGKSLYRSVVPADEHEGLSGWLVVDPYNLNSISISVSTMEDGIAYVKNLEQSTT